MATLPVKKIYLDTKFKRYDSISTSNFKIDLPQTIKLPQNCILQVDDINIPRVWYTVEQGVNDKLYFRLQLANGGNSTDYILQLEPRFYNTAQFKHEIVSKITGLTNGAVTTGTIDDNTQTLAISVANLDINFFTDEQLSDPLDGIAWGGSAYDKRNLNSGNELITNVVPNLVGNSQNPLILYLNLTPVRNIYMKSPNLSSFNTIGCNGESTIIKKIPVNVPQNQMITASITSGTDFIPADNLTLKTIEIRLEDVNGNIINLHNFNMSFSIIFDIMKSEQ